MSAPRAAGIYCRISYDPDDTALGVARQEKDCRALAERKGWAVAEVYVDNDQSAWSGKIRPAYSRLLDDIKANTIDAVVVWHLDRLHRHPRELEEFFTHCDAAGLRDLASVTGDVDLGTDDGRFMARILGAVAKKESDDKSRRQRRKAQEMADAGRPAAGGYRPFGYELDMTVRPDEAALLREATTRVLAGEPLNAVVRDWTAREIPTVTGAAWSRTVLKNILTSGRIAGVRYHLDRRAATGTWEPIIDEITHRRLRALLIDPARSNRHPKGRYLLSGLLHCSKCGTRMVGSVRDGGRRAYVCPRGKDRPGCGGRVAVTDPLEAHVVAAVQLVLDGGLPDASLAGDATGPLLDEIARLEAAHDQAAADHYTDGLLDRQAFFAASRAIRDRQAQLRAEARRHGRALQGSMGAPEMRARWPGLDVDQQRAVLAAVMERIDIGPPVLRGRNTFDPARVAITWRV